MAASVSRDDLLAYEEAGHRTAGIAALLGGLGTFAWLLVSLIFLNDLPQGRSFAVSLERVGDGQPIGDMPALRTPAFEWLQDHGALQVIAAALLGLGAVAAGYALLFLARAARARAERFTSIALYLPPVGGVMVLVGVLMVTVSGALYAGDVLATDGTVGALAGVAEPGVQPAGQFVRFFGNLLLGLGFVLVSLSAMRVGLLTRNMGLIGVLAGALVLLPGVQTFIIQAFWLVALGFLLLRIWPGNAIPPAWKTGDAEPWPSAADERARRQRAAAERRGTPMPPEPEVVEERAASAKAHPSSKKKRKRRT